MKAIKIMKCESCPCGKTCGHIFNIHIPYNDVYFFSIDRAFINETLEKTFQFTFTLNKKSLSKRKKLVWLFWGNNIQKFKNMQIKTCKNATAPAFIASNCSIVVTIVVCFQYKNSTILYKKFNLL